MLIGSRFGKKGHKKIHLGISLFIDDTGGMTSLAIASSLLVCLSLAFALVSAGWISLRAYKTQSIADAAALAGQNVVAKYTTIAQVVDASILSMGLSGLICVGAGLVASCIPGVTTIGSELCDAGFKTLEARKKFADSAVKGLEQTEKVLPVFAAYTASTSITKNSNNNGDFIGSALLFPQNSLSNFGHLDDEISSDDLKKNGEELQKISKTIDEIHQKMKDSKQRAWEADCGGSPYSMRERADHLAHLSPNLNKYISSPSSWTFEMALNRARAYYRARYSQETISTVSPDEFCNSAIRKMFYNFASQTLSKGFSKENIDGEVQIYLPRLPHNLEETKETSLYLDAIWPCTHEDGKRVIHAHTPCPGANGAAAGFASLQDLDSGGVSECSYCHLNSVAVGSVASASTNTTNGFEHYWRIVVEESEKYSELVRQLKDQQEQLRNVADTSSSLFSKAINQLKVTRPRLCPPGAWGCISVVKRNESSPQISGMLGYFEQKVSLPAGYAISGSVLAPDESLSSNVLSGFFSQIEKKGGLIGQSLNKIMGLWGHLLTSYGQAGQEWNTISTRFFDEIDGAFGGTVGHTLKHALQQIIKDAGLEPTDLRQVKPVLVNTEDILKQSGFAKESIIRDLVQKIPNSTDPLALAKSLGIWGSQFLPEKIVVATLVVPVLEIEIPLEIEVRKVFGGV